MAVNARVLAALEQEVQDAINLDSATYDDLTAAQISLAISHAKTIAPALSASSVATVKAVNTQEESGATFASDNQTGSKTARSIGVQP
jgi:hypothetical protein